MEPYLNKPFEILFDLNEFSTTRCLPIHWMTQVFQLIFSELNDYLVSLYLYNSSFYLPTYISKLHPNIANRLAKRAYICNGLNEIYEYISPSELKLAKQSGK
jgi:neurofibromin 1